MQGGGVAARSRAVADASRHLLPDCGGGGGAGGLLCRADQQDPLRGGQRGAGGAQAQQAHPPRHRLERGDRLAGGRGQAALPMNCTALNCTV